MPQIKLPLMAILIAAALTLSGCGNRNDSVLFTQETAHKANADWVHNHKTTARANLDSCTECHGSDFAGGISKVSCMSATAQSGFTCHSVSAADFQTGCVSCHGGLPNGPFGTAAPNKKSAHSVHTTLTGCETCHFNAGSGTAAHAKATSAGGFNSATLASNDTITFNADGTCDNVSCHGGQKTPDWATGSIDIVPNNNVVCKQCHEQGTSAGRPQYNSYYSGLHVFHIGFVGANCTDCHNVGALTSFQQHFGGIAAKTFTSPRQTIGLGAPTKILTYTAAQTCTTPVGVGCHPSVVTIPWIQP